MRSPAAARKWVAKSSSAAGCAGGAVGACLRRQNGYGDFNKPFTQTAWSLLAFGFLLLFPFFPPFFYPVCERWPTTRRRTVVDKHTFVLSSLLLAAARPWAPVASGLGSGLGLRTWARAALGSWARAWGRSPSSDGAQAGVPSGRHEPRFLRLPAPPSAARPASRLRPAQLGCACYVTRHRALVS